MSPEEKREDFFVGLKIVGGIFLTLLIGVGVSVAKWGL